MGGEPLLEFELIKKCVSYILQRKGDKKIRFTMTTNGTLMTEDVIEFLVKYEFNLMISLDGDKKSHDGQISAYAFVDKTISAGIESMRAFKNYISKIA